ncbi:hypothetical protein TNCV_3965891 [Trichonephila clavipes]|nr:hypothetical protein TNCV_3965891 [Trichonephila clavipes]
MWQWHLYKGSNCSHNIKIRNSDFCSVLDPGLIAIDEALRIIKTMIISDEIWILCDSRSAIQHLSDWTNVGDKTWVSILKNLKELSQQHEIYNGFHLTLVSLAMTQLTF